MNPDLTADHQKIMERHRAPMKGDAAMPIKINKTVYEESRKRLNLSHVEVARRAGVSYQTLRNWLTGARHPNSENVDKLSEVLGEHPARLFKLVKKENQA